MKVLLAFAAQLFLTHADSTSVSNFKRASTTSGTPVVSVKGNAFWADNKRFYIRGLDYQPGGEAASKDPIADFAGCKRDLEYFKQLGINTVRVYTVDNSASHDDCMKLLSDAGIYVAVSVSSTKYSLNRLNSWSLHASYNEVYLQSVFATVDAFSKYDNTLLFFSANEVISQNETFAAPYIKAQIRDMKQYIKQRGYRPIPIGYAATDVIANRYEVANYLNCGPDTVRSDFLAFNDYSFCGPGIFKGSQWEPKVKNLSSYSIPVFLGEYGCKEVQPRTFNEVPVLYSSDMTPVYSGGLIYEYSMEETKFGLVKLNGGSVSELPDFKTLQTAYQKSPQPDGDGGYKSNNQPSKCPPTTQTWNVNTSLPLTPRGAIQLIQQGAGPGLGDHDPKYPNGSQWVGTPSPGWGDADAGTNGASSGSSGSSGGAKNGTKSAATIVQAAPGISFLMLLFGFLVGAY